MIQYSEERSGQGDSSGRPALISADVTSKIAGFKVPSGFYFVLSEPAPLAGMVLPRPPGPDWEGLRTLGFRWVVCLCSDYPGYDPAPLEHLAKVELTDLVDGGEPGNPQMEEKGIRILGKMVYEKLLAGEGVIVHCVGGRGRTGTVLGTILRKFGYSADEAVDFLAALNRARGRPGWPEAPWQQGVVERVS